MDQVVLKAAGMPPDQVRQNREDYILAGDRARARPDPYFVGRKLELAIFREALELTSEEGGSCGKDETLVVQGPPGAGKTALLEECAVLAAARPDHVVVRLQPDELGSAHGLIRAIDAAVGVPAAQRISRKVAERGGRIGPVALGPKAATAEPAATLLKAREGMWKHKVIVLLVDEAQNVPVSDASRGVVQYLHGAAREVRILLACYGLGDTLEVLSEAGVSRLSARRVNTLRALAISEARESIARVFAACGVQGSEAARDRWLDALADLSQGWPQHVRAITSATLEELSACGMSTAACSLERAISAGQAATQRYYEQRLAGVALWMPAYRRLADELDNSAFLRLHRLAELVRPLLQECGTSLEEFLTASVHAGVLGREDSRYTIPVPSFAEYLRRD